MEIDRLRLAALIHDLGRTAIDPAILDKTTPLTEMEEASVRRHPQIGFEQLG